MEMGCGYLEKTTPSIERPLVIEYMMDQTQSVEGI
jgi:hypothetical protein